MCALICHNVSSKGSVKVDFNLEHTYYLDQPHAPTEALREILENELKQGKLGLFSASMEDFEFQLIKTTSGEQECASFFQELIV